MRGRSESGGLYMVSCMPSGPNTCAARYRSRRSPDTRSTIFPARYAPMSLYTNLVPGSASSGSAIINLAMLSPLVVMRS